jgi:hypothetical protein
MYFAAPFVVVCYLFGLWYFDLSMETEFVLVLLFLIVPTLDYDSAFLASASSQWLLLVPNGGLDRFVLIYVPFTSVTALCGPLSGPCHLFDSFLNYCNYLCTILVYFESIVGELTPFSFLGSLISSCKIRSGEDHSFNPFLIQLKKIKKHKMLP